MEFERRRLLNRIRKVSPRLVVFSAPAGFGKTTAARQFGASFPSFSICDCGGITSERDFVRRLIATRAGSAGSDADLSQIQVSLGEAGGSGDDVEAALRAWSSGVASTAVIFENVEDVLESAALRKLFDRALVMTPDSCTLIVCSRKPLRLQASRVAPPHRIVTLRAEDLAFDRTEIGAVFARAKLAKDVLDEIALVTRGWPIGVLMLRRLADEGRLAASLANLDDVALDDMHGYLVDEVFASLAPDERDAVIACAAFSTATPAEVAAALGSAYVDENDAEELLRRVAPLATVTPDGGFAIHPLLAVAIEGRFRSQRIAFGVTAARAFEARGELFAAARVYHRLGKVDEAARLLCAEASAATRGAPAGFGALLATLDADTLARYPVLRGLTTYARRFRCDPHQLREETSAVWRTMQDADFQLRCNVGNPLARIMYETGHFDEAEALLRELERETGGIPDIPRNSGQAYIARTLACVLARQGRLGEAAPYFQKGYFSIPGAEFVMSRAWIETAIVERLHGRLDEERRLFDRAIAHALEANASVHIACAFAEAAFGAWLAGDRNAMLEYVRRLDERIRGDAMPGFAHFCAVAYGDAEANTNGTEQPNWLACAHLVASAATSGDDRLRHAEVAKKAAEASSDRFLRLLAALALGLASPAQRSERFAEALLHAAAIEAAAPRAAVAALIADGNDLGMLAGFVAAFRAGRPNEEESVRVEVLSLGVHRGGELVPLPERELAIVLALARQRKAYARAEIASLVWPDLDEDAAREAFNSTLYRLRRRLPDVVTYARDGYRLDERVRVDLRELEHWVGSLTSQRPLREQERIVFRALHDRLCAIEAPSEDDETWAWLVPIFLRADDTRRTIAERLAHDALRRGDHEDALLLARQLVAEDSCDEAAREIAIRAYLLTNRRAEALREFRQYRDALKAELDAEPSVALARLLREPDTPADALPVGARAS
jgi:DNA-binding SARP family transcriptional activator